MTLIVTIFVFPIHQAKDLETTLKNLPPPSEAQVAAIDKLINSLAEEWQVDKAMAKQRQEVVTQLSNLLMERIKGQYVIRQTMRLVLLTISCHIGCFL